ncbi:MAG: signal peptidase I [Jiangellaceae bacterium]
MAASGRVRRIAGVPGPRSLRVLLLVALAALVVVAAYAWIGRIYTVTTGSMRPTLEPGERVLVSRVGRDDVRRGDVVVVDVRGTWARAGSDDDPTVVKRVVGLPGESVACCDARGRVTVDGEPLDEAYLSPGGVGAPFDMVVPAGRLWLLGDDRDNSVDSRDHLGAPGGGSVQVEAVQGRVVAVLWPRGASSGEQGSVDVHGAAAKAGAVP